MNTLEKLQGLTLSRRNASIELLRIIFMFGICLIHASSNSVFPKNIAQPSVVGFIFISGYFGVRFRLSKIIGLYVLAISYCVLSRFAAGDFEFESVVYAWGAPWHYWFLHAYAILMTITPMLEKAFEGGGLKEAIPYVSVIFLWGYSLLFPSLKDIIPNPEGLTVTSFMMMLGVYLAARIIRMYKIAQRIPFSVAVGCSIGLMIVIAFSRFYLCANLCIVSFIFVLMLFSTFEKIKLSSVVQKVVLAISPSMFGVYILHELLVAPGGSKCIFGLMKDVCAAFSQYGVLAYFVSAAVVFGLSLLVDFVRRACLKLVNPLVIKVNAYLDSSYEKIVDRLDQSMRK